MNTKRVIQISSLLGAAIALGGCARAQKETTGKPAGEPAFQELSVIKMADGKYMGVSDGWVEGNGNQIEVRESEKGRIFAVLSGATLAKIAENDFSYRVGAAAERNGNSNIRNGVCTLFSDVDCDKLYEQLASDPDKRRGGLLFFDVPLKSATGALKTTAQTR